MIHSLRFHHGHIRHFVAVIASAALLGCGDTPPQEKDAADTAGTASTDEVYAASAGDSFDIPTEDEAVADTVPLVEALKLVLASSSTPMRYHLQLAQVYYKSGDYARAATEYNAALDIDSRDATAQVVLARAITRDATGEDQTTALAGLVERFPRSARIALEYGKALRRNGDLSGAVATLKKAAGLDRDDSEALYEYHLTRGRMLRQEQDLSGAINALSAAVELFPDKRNARLELHITETRVEAQRGDFVAAVDAARRAVDADPSSAAALYAYHFNMGHLNRSRKQFPESILEFQRACELAPSTTGPHVALGHALVLAGRHAEARTKLEYALSLDEENLNALHSLAKVYESIDERSLARETWVRLLEIDTAGRYEEEGKIHLHLLDRIDSMSRETSSEG